MNTVAVVIALAVMVTVSSALGYNSYNSYNSYPSSFGIRAGRNINRWNLGSQGGFRRHKRAAVEYGSYDPYNRHNIGGMFNRRSGGWRSHSRFNGGWNQYGY